MVDAVGNTSYSYDSVGQLLSEDGPWASDTVSYTYQNRLRTGLSISAPNATAWTQGYGYDSAKRLTSISSPAGAFTYILAATSSGSPLIKKLLLPSGAYITNTYDSVARLTGTYLKNSSDGVLNSHEYVYSLANQRTKQTLTGGNFVDYTYDKIGQLKTAFGKESGGVTNRLQERLGYTYDAAGNLNYRTNNALIQTFNVNSLNELTSVERSGTLTVAGTTTSAATNVTVNSLPATLYSDYTFARESIPLVNAATNFTAIGTDSYGRSDSDTISVSLQTPINCLYDLNGNLRTNGTRIFAYDDENQLISITEPTAWKAEFVYDGKMRCRVEKNFRWIGAAFQQTNEVRFVYDGNVPVQHRDTNNLPVITLTRGRDLSGSFEGAGGIGGILAMTTSQLTIIDSPSSAHDYFHADANGNVTCLIGTNQAVSATYVYDPFGNTLSIRGPRAGQNSYRFSGKPVHALSGMIYYLYRFYIPDGQRWLNRDPLGDEASPVYRRTHTETDASGDGVMLVFGPFEIWGTTSLLTFVRNNPGNAIDSFGLCDFLSCMAKCVEQKNPLNECSALFRNLGKAAAAVGFPIPKSLLKKIGFRVIQSPGASRFTTVGGVLNRFFGSTARGALRVLGRISFWPTVGYGLYMAGAEAACLGTCLGDSCSY